MGRVYRAHDPVLDRPVALKTVSPALLSRRDTLARFQREARAAARLSHPNIVTIYEVGEADGTRYIAMELVEGIELSEVLLAPDRYPLEQKVRIMVDVCRGLDFAHQMGVVHRDVKPANIRVARDGTVKILDFGIARLGESDMTQAGIVLGTPSYLSPELLQGAPVDPRADMWAVGVILYEMLSGRRPFEAPTITALVHRIVSEPLPPLDAEALRLPAALVAVVSRALEKDPSRRFPDLGSMAAALVAAIGGTPGAEGPIDPVVRKRAFEANFAEARRRLTEDDLSGALDAARRAQGVDPARTGIVDLIRVIEERLRVGGDDPAPPSPARSGEVPPTPDGRHPAPDRRAADRATRPPAHPPPRARPCLPARSTRPRCGRTGQEPSASWARSASRRRRRSPRCRPPPTCSPSPGPTARSGCGTCARAPARTCCAPTCTCARGTTRPRSRSPSRPTARSSPRPTWTASSTCGTWRAARRCPVKLRHDNAVATLAFSPDGATLATGSLDANLRLWDVGAAVAGEARRELIRQPSGVTALAWAGGGEWILTGHARVLRLSDPVRGKLLASIRGPEGLVSLLVPSPDGRLMAAASHDRTVRLFDLGSRQETARLGPLKKPATALCFVADGGFLATVCQDNSVQLWDLDSCVASAALWGPADECFMSLALYGDSNALAVALADGRIRVWGPA